VKLTCLDEKYCEFVQKQTFSSSLELGCRLQRIHTDGHISKDLGAGTIKNVIYYTTATLCLLFYRCLQHFGCPFIMLRGRGDVISMCHC